MSTLVALPAQSFDSRRPAARGASVRLEITRRGRLVLSALVFVAVLVIAAVAFVGLGGSAAFASLDGGREVVTVTVQPGDTVWSYAEKYHPQGMDVRDYVLAVQERNGLSGGRLSAGETLELPILPAQG